MVFKKQGEASELSRWVDVLYFVTDFGFAQYLHSEEQTQTMRGSPLYMVRYFPVVNESGLYSYERTFSWAVISKIYVVLIQSLETRFKSWDPACCVEFVTSMGLQRTEISPRTNWTQSTHHVTDLYVNHLFLFLAACRTKWAPPIHSVKLPSWNFVLGINIKWPTQSYPVLRESKRNNVQNVPASTGNPKQQYWKVHHFTPIHV